MNMNIHQNEFEFAQKAIALAKEMGVNALVVTGNGVGINTGIWSAVDGFMSRKVPESLAVFGPTWRTIYEWCQNAKKDDFGMIDLWGNGDWQLQVYSGGDQINLLYKDTPVADFLFDLDEGTFTPVRVSRGVADYDNCTQTFPIDEPIQSYTGYHVTWPEILGPSGGSYQEIFRDFFIPIHEEDYKKTCHVI